MFLTPRRVAVAAAVAAMIAGGPCAFAQSSSDVSAVSTPDQSGMEPRGWRGALKDSFTLLMLEHAGRIAFQEKTRKELGGPFFEDYYRSVKVPHTWEDGDGWFVNYMGHPIHGAASSRIWLDHSPGNPPFGSKAYFASRGIAAVWAAGYSLQFEFGPLSEASIGNVGMDPATTGWVDHVVTPAGALAMTIAEDALDTYLVKFIERHTRNRAYRASVRVFFNPSRALANITEGRTPWFRAGRPLR
jgi:hypothetical protein